MNSYQITFDTETLPKAGNAERLALGFERWREEADEKAEDDPNLGVFMRESADNPATARLMSAIFGNSPFLANCLWREPEVLRDFLQNGPDSAFDSIINEAVEACRTEGDLNRLMSHLRIAKRRSALLIALADISGLWSLYQVTGALTRMADTGLEQGAAFLLRQSMESGDLVLPYPDEPTRDSGLVILGMGKMGARELNYSSDIDIIVFFDSERMDYRGRLSLPEHMVRLTKTLVRIMDERTADGYVYRTDLRLRPDPGSTPPAISLIAAETYYESFGQNWERAAMIKARAVAGDIPAGEKFLKNLRPFIWRKYLDFAAIQDIHSIKRQINAHRGGKTIAVAGHNIKLGRGGIREIEFFAQTQQLIWGGRDPSLRSNVTLTAIEALSAAGKVEPEAVLHLNEAYHYLRRLEHRLQMIDDKQTQTLPSEADKLGELAIFAGHADFEEFSAVLVGHLRMVENHYANLFEDAPALGTETGSLVFTGGENDPETVSNIAAMGFPNPEAICSTIRGWHHGRIRATRSTRARELLTELTPALLLALSRTADPDEAFLKLDEFLSRLPAGVQVFSLFTSYPPMLDLVAEIMGDAPRLAEHLARHPSLLDSVLSQGFLDALPEGESLARDLDIALDHVNSYEEVLDVCRRWNNDQKFRIGVQLMRGLIDASTAGSVFTRVAETALARLIPHVERSISQQHGIIPGAGLVVLAMGKMGGREMTATSDLDLILVYETPPDIEQSDGPKPLMIPVYYARFTQRLISAITSQTAEGKLYEVDMRLRPSGNSGPIACSLATFLDYQSKEAWTWEHMALTRARVIWGDPVLAKRVEAGIKEIICRPRDPAKLAVDVADMRSRMEGEHRGDQLWEVKSLRGGLIDIEFIVQYLELRYAHETPGVLSTNSIEALSRLCEEGPFDHEDAERLKEGLRLWTSLQAILRLTIEGKFREEEASSGLRAKLARAADCPDFGSLKAHMTATAERIQGIFRRLIDAPAAAHRPYVESQQSS